MQPISKNPFALLLILFIGIATYASAQQPQTANSVVKTNVSSPSTSSQYRAGYTFTILTGANNTYGYDVVKNGVVVLHQPAETTQAQPIKLTSAIQAQRAAMFVIYKMKRNIQPATLSNDELKKVTIN